MSDEQLMRSLNGWRNIAKLKITPAREWVAGDGEDGPTGALIPGSLLVDASELAASPNDVRWWQIDNDDDHPDMWHHAPSHGPDYFPLGDALAGIGCCYTLPLDEK